MEVINPYNVARILLDDIECETFETTPTIGRQGGGGEEGTPDEVVPHHLHLKKRPFFSLR